MRFLVIDNSHKQDQLDSQFVGKVKLLSRLRAAVGVTDRETLDLVEVWCANAGNGDRLVIESARGLLIVAIADAGRCCAIRSIPQLVRTELDRVDVQDV